MGKERERERPASTQWLPGNKIRIAMGAVDMRVLSRGMSQWRGANGSKNGNTVFRDLLYLDTRKIQGRDKEELGVSPQSREART